MGFQPVLDDGLYLTYFRIDTERGVCMIVIDARSDDVSETELVRELDYYGVSLADFWNQYDATGESGF